VKNLTWQNPEQLFVAQELINKVKSKCCGIKEQNDTSTLKLFPFLLLISDELVFFVLDKVFKTVSL